ncbi:MAG: XRE family transcriptional regulator [Spirochaetaceae bacterium]|jgi:phage repressor protein C with HTH and peptisase S24 domain|nr:XRE family transcriptional regulator [Spirochaetaceae bacterium]
MEWARIIQEAERIIQSMGKSKADLAEILGVTPQFVADVKSGKSKNPRPSFALSLVTKLNFNPEWLLSGEGMMFSERAPHEQSSSNKKPIPVFSVSELPEKAFLVPLLDQKLSAGSGNDLPEDDIEKGLIPVPSYLAKYGKDIKALAVESDSMYPTLHRGDMVVCDSCGWSGEGIYAVRMNGKGFVKRVTQKPGKVVLLSDNPKYPPYEEAEESQDIEIVGRVHCAITKVD